MTDNRRPMVLASFAADSLALGVHWIYDTDKIKKDFGRVDTLRKPLRDSYHPTKEDGESFGLLVVSPKFFKKRAKKEEEQLIGNNVL